MSDFQEKLKSLGFARVKGTSRKTPVRRDDDGTVGGHQTEHWDDRVDAVVQPKTAELKLQIKKPGVDR